MIVIGEGNLGGPNEFVAFLSLINLSTEPQTARNWMAVMRGAGAAGGVVMPAGVPRPIINKLNAEIRAILADPPTRARIEDLGADIPDTTPEQFADFMKAERKKWSEVVKTANVKVE